jgi:hypothetical protein
MKWCVLRDETANLFMYKQSDDVAPRYTGSGVVQLTTNLQTTGISISKN